MQPVGDGADDLRREGVAEAVNDERLMEMAVARTGPLTELTMAALSGPVLRKRKNSAAKSAGTAQAAGPKKTSTPQGRVSATLQKESR